MIRIGVCGLGLRVGQLIRESLNACNIDFRRGCFNCPEKVSTLEKVSDYRKLLIAPRCSEIISK